MGNALVARGVSAARVWAALIGGQLRSQLSYPSSFALNTLTSFANGWIEFIELYVLLRATPTLGGLTFAQAGLVYALANLGFSVADLIFGQLDSMPTQIRTGRLEISLVRPVPLLAQLITSQVQLRRLGRTFVGLVVLVVVLATLRLPATPHTIYLLLITPIVGCAIYGSWFVMAGGLQFWLIDGAQFTNAFVYGGNYASQLPGGVLVAPLRIFFTFVLPALATAYLPVLLILGIDGPAFVPSWVGWFAPALAVTSWLLAMACWRGGIRNYTGAGG